MEKVIRDGKVAVLYSPEYGAGWSTWCYDDALVETLLFHPLIVEKEVVGNIHDNDLQEWLIE